MAQEIINKVTEEMRQELRKPLPAGAVTKHPTKSYLSSIKAIYVTERLNDVFGIGSWQLRTEVIEAGNDKGMVVVKTILCIPSYGVYYESFGGNDNGGSGNKNFDLGDAYKGATTDGLTKICSFLEIGIDVFKGNSNSAKPSNSWNDKNLDAKLEKHIENTKQPNVGELNAQLKKVNNRDELEVLWGNWTEFHKHPVVSGAFKVRGAELKEVTGNVPGLLGKDKTPVNA